MSASSHSSTWPLPPSPETTPSPSSAEIATPKDRLDWDDYYWGYSDDTRARRRNVIRPLSWAVTDRFPLELVSTFLEFLCDIRDLYNCALVCRAWYPHCQTLLYSHIDIRSHRAYRLLTQLSLQCPQTRNSLASTHTLCFTRGMDDNTRLSPSTQDNYYQTLPHVLGGTMPKLRSLAFRRCLSPPYHSSFVALMPRLTEVVHLDLFIFKVSSCMDLLRIILSLPKLRDLRLAQGSVASDIRTPFHYTPVFARGRSAPRLARIHLNDLHPSLLSTLASWMVSSGVCKQLVFLSLDQLSRNQSGYTLGDPSALAIVQSLDPSLVDLYYTSPSGLEQQGEPDAQRC